MSDSGGGRRVAVIGDVGGHVGTFAAELRRLGVDPDTGYVPPDLDVVQVGDLVHRGPRSEEVVAIVDRILFASPRRWIQLIGNHEAYYVQRHATFFWREPVDPVAVDVLRGWWSRGVMRPAAVVATGGAELLVTHAGLTRGFWRDVLGSPPTAREAAAALVDLGRRSRPELFRGGGLLGGGAPDPGAGPLWASASSELIPSWFDAELPFGQLHGHSCLYDRARHRFRGGAPIEAATRLDVEAGFETTTLTGGVIAGVDPGHEADVAPTWRSWEPADLEGGIAAERVLMSSPPAETTALTVTAAHAPARRRRLGWPLGGRAR